MNPVFTCYFVIVSDIKYFKMGDKVTALAKLAGSRRVTHKPIIDTIEYGVF
jgi:hypothetical protein